MNADAASLDQRRFLEAFARHLALAVERARWAAQAGMATLKTRTEELRSSLLSTVSHDLRTPLASITGAATALLDHAAPLPEAEREELLGTICGEAERLERLVGNLLDMTRLEAGGLQPRREWVPLEELVLLDLGLPDGDGLVLARKLREWSKVPIIVLSARDREDDKVVALDAGADDYLTKPFGVNELLARMRVALRHAQKSPDQPLLELGALTLDLAKRLVTVNGKEVHLTPIEYRLLALLAQNEGKVLTHRQILSEVWGPCAAHQTHYVRVHLAELRKKIETDPSRPKLIVTEPGVGYRLHWG